MKHRQFRVTLRADATFGIKVYASSAEAATRVAKDAVSRGWLRVPEKATDWTVIKATPVEEN